MKVTVATFAKMKQEKQKNGGYKMGKTKEKKQLIKEVIEKLVLNGYDITPFIGKPLSYFNYEKVKKLLEEDTFYKE